MSVNINDNGIEVPIGELQLLLGKQQVVIGNAERDLILRTAGNIKIQIGNKYIDLPITNTDNDSVAASTSIIIANLTGYTYPGDGYFVYTTDDKELYFTSNGAYEPISKDDAEQINKVYLSYLESQSLNGAQKNLLLRNSGLLVDSFSDVGYLDPSLVYSNQFLFAGDTRRIYGLDSIEGPSDKASWSPLFINRSGDTVTGNIFIEALQDKGLSTNVSLLIGSNSDKYGLGTSLTEQFNGLLIGQKDLTSGLALYDAKGKSSYITSQGPSITFLTNGAGSPFNPLNINEDTVGVNTTVPTGYRFAVKGNNYLNGKSVYTDDLKSDEYTGGTTGSGFGLYKIDGKWTIEVDYLKVRSSGEFTGDVNDVTALNGSKVIDFSLILKDTRLYETIYLYTKASVSGKYKDTVGTLVPWSERSTTVNAFRTPITSLPDVNVDSTTAQSYDTVDLAFGIGDIGVSDPTYLRDTTSTYRSLQGQFSYNGEFNQDDAGDLVLSGTINVYVVATDVAVTVGDLFYYKRWDKNKISTEATVELVEVVKTFGDHFYIYSYNGTITEGDALVKIGNRYTDVNVIELNSGDAVSGYIQSFKGVRSFNETIPSYYKDEIGGGYSIDPVDFLDIDPIIPVNRVTSRIGNLVGIVDDSLGLVAANNIDGQYFGNAFIKGNINAIRATMGDQLTFFENKLTIADLEIIKNRTIKGVGPLSGGGKLFDADIEITHNKSNWNDKVNLSGGSVISNIKADTCGHLISWETRDLDSRYLQTESDTLDTVLARGNVATQEILLRNNLVLAKAAADNDYDGTRLQMTDNLSAASLGFAIHLGNAGHAYMRTFTGANNIGEWINRLKIDNATGDLTVYKGLILPTQPTVSTSTFDVLTINKVSGRVEKKPVADLDPRIALLEQRVTELESKLG